MTLDEAVNFAFQIHDGGQPEVDREAVHDLIASEVDRLAALTTWEAGFARSVLEPLADELYKPQLGNAALA